MIRINCAARFLRGTWWMFTWRAIELPSMPLRMEFNFRFDRYIPEAFARMKIQP